MTTSQNQSLLSKPEGESAISPKSLAYVAGLSRLQLHELVLDAFEQSGITQVTLARRLNKRPEQISRILAAPGNLTIDTAAEMLFAIDGSLSRVERYRPNAAARRNSAAPGWLSLPASSTESTTITTFTHLGPQSFTTAPATTIITKDVVVD